jgi:hypothetical protein
VNPGQGDGVGAYPKDMKIYESAGQKQLKAYEEVIKGNKADTKIVDVAEDLNKYGQNGAFLNVRKNSEYKCVDSEIMIHDLKQLLNFGSPEIGFSMKTVGRMVTTVVSPAGSNQIINRGTYDKEGRFVVWQDAFKENDKAPSNKKVPLNEMGMQNFIATAGDKTKNFKVAFLMDIQNKEFWGITRQSYNDKMQPFEQVLTFQHGTPQFERFMGSPNINSKFYYFINHHNAIGNKTPEKVIVIPKQVENSGGKLTVALVFK